MSAISAIDLALWDIKAKALDVPVYQLLGGKVREKIPVYANGWFEGLETPEEHANAAKKIIDSGYKCLKFYPFIGKYNIENENIYKGIEFINDSKATNLGALKSALENYTHETVVLIAGGEGKGSRFEEFSEIIDGKLKTLIVMGRDGGRLAVISERLNIATFHVDSIEEAVEKGFEIAHEGDTVLLSPACASLDMFKNFEERGQRFELAVRQLINRSSEIG